MENLRYSAIRVSFWRLSSFYVEILVSVCFFPGEICYYADLTRKCQLGRLSRHKLLVAPNSMFLSLSDFLKGFYMPNTFKRDRLHLPTPRGAKIRILRRLQIW